MATYYAGNSTATTTAAQKIAFDQKQIVAEPHGFDITVPFAFNTAALATAHTLLNADIIQLVKLPQGATILDYKLNLPILDTSTGIALSLGLSVKAASTLVFVSSSVVSRSSAIGTITPVYTLSATTLSAPATTIAQALPYAELTANDVLILTATAGCTTAGAGGVISGFVKYITRGQTSF